jgi:hypothetical protein
MEEYYNRVIEVCKSDVDRMLLEDAEKRSPKVIMTYLDTIEECNKRLEHKAESDWDKLSKEAQDKITAIIKEDLHGR